MQYRKEAGKEFPWQQQQNFVMLLQTIGMRVNPQYNAPPSVEEVNLKDYNFGTAYKGKHRVWTWEFFIEYDGGFTDVTGDPIGLLIKDLHFVPMIVDLTETVDFKLAMFDSQSTDLRNILVYVE
jgi:hypothetical protein